MVGKRSSTKASDGRSKISKIHKFWRMSSFPRRIVGNTPIRRTCWQQSMVLCFMMAGHHALFGNRALFRALK